MLSAFFFIGSLIGALLTINGLRRRSLWLPAMIRRTYDEMRAFDWQGDPEPYLTYLHRFTVPEQSLGE